jgi:hypothetical protein
MNKGDMSSTYRFIGGEAQHLEGVFHAREFFFVVHPWNNRTPRLVQKIVIFGSGQFILLLFGIRQGGKELIENMERTFSLTLIDGY